MSPRSVRRATERRAQKEARKAANRTYAMTPKTSSTGRTVLLPSDHSGAFEQHVAAYHAEYQPVGLRETELVQSLAETRWRLQRIVSLEAALFAQPAAEEDASAPTDLDNLLKYEKTLKNLQESRLNRRFDKDLAELRALTEARVQAELSRIEEKAGFEFSVDEAALLSDPNAQHEAGFEFSTLDAERPEPLANAA